MTDLQPFTALYLPFLALEMAIELMDIYDQLSLSKVSKRCQRIVKYIHRNRKYRADLFFSYGLLIIEIGYKKTNQIFTLHLENAEMDQIKDEISHLNNTFAVDNISFHFYGISCNLMLDVVPFVKELGMTLGSVGAGKNGEDDELCEFMLKECCIAKSLDVNIPISPKFSLPLTSFGSFQCNRFVLYRASWFTMNHVISWLMNCKEIKLYDSSFSAQDVNRFLKKWMEQSSVEHLLLTNLNGAMYSLDEVLNDIPATPSRAAKLKDDLFAPRNGFIVQQKGGLEVFVYQPLNYCFKMTTEYVLEIEEENR